jgi:hypothetical protein
MHGASATPELITRDRDLFTDPRVRSVKWSDLTRLSRLEVMKELTLSLPWLALSLYLVHRHQYVLAAGVSFMFFLAGLRQVHDAYHYNLGLSRAATEWVMYALSVVMLGSMHAVQLNHLKHHAHCMDDDDVEARSARMSGLQAFVWGPVFPVLLHKEALRLAGRDSGAGYSGNWRPTWPQSSWCFRCSPWPCSAITSLSWRLGIV